MSWISDSWQTIKALKTPENNPLLPIYPSIAVEDIPPASSLLFYGLPGNWATERIEAFKYGFKWHPPFHAALMMRDGIFHNVGKFRTDDLLRDEFQPGRRIDVIVYTKMTDLDRIAIMQATELDTSVPHTGFEITDYGVTTFLHQGFKFIGKSKEPICSEDVVRLLGTRQIKCSNDIPNETTPADLVQFSLDNSGLCELRTAWVGSDYHR